MLWIVGPFLVSWKKLKFFFFKIVVDRLCIFW